MNSKLRIPLCWKALPEDMWEKEHFGDTRYRRLAESYARGIPWKWPDAEWSARDDEEVARRSSEGPGTQLGKD